MGGPTTITWRGSRFDPRTAAMLAELARLVDGYVQPSQGSYNTSVEASGGTHSGGGAVDIRCSNLTHAQEDGVILVGRRIGFAMWRRTPSQGPWPTHIHGIAIGCDDLSSAAARQVTAYRNGRNGLANNGPDDGPDVGFTTWENYLKSQEDDMADYAAQLEYLEEQNRAIAGSLAYVSRQVKSVGAAVGAQSVALADGEIDPAELRTVLDRIAGN